MNSSVRASEASSRGPFPSEKSRLSRFLLLLFAGGLLACSGSANETTGEGDDAEGTGGEGVGAAGSGSSNAGGSESGGADSGSGGQQLTGGAPPGGTGGSETGGATNETETYEGGPCPETAPVQGDPCEVAGATCSYGAAEAPGCRDAFQCNLSGTWISSSYIAGACVVVSGPCETTPEGSCDQVGLTCQEGESVCTCTPEQTQICTGDGCTIYDPPIPQQWSCRFPQLGPGCPVVAPNAGTQCESTTISCSYGDPCGGTYVTCREGYHHWEAALCP